MLYIVAIFFCCCLTSSDRMLDSFSDIFKFVVVNQLSLEFSHGSRSIDLLSNTGSIPVSVVAYKHNPQDVRYFYYTKCSPHQLIFSSGTAMVPVLLNLTLQPRNDLNKCL